MIGVVLFRWKTLSTEKSFVKFVIAIMFSNGNLYRIGFRETHNVQYVDMILVGPKREPTVPPYPRGNRWFPLTPSLKWASEASPI
jgi:hypothetical protein